MNATEVTSPASRRRAHGDDNRFKMKPEETLGDAARLASFALWEGDSDERHVRDPSAIRVQGHIPDANPSARLIIRQIGGPSIEVEFVMTTPGATLADVAFAA